MGSIPSGSSMLRSKRWPWLTEGWEYVEDVQWDELLEHNRLLVKNEPPQFFDFGYFYAPYIPEERLKDGNV